MRRLVSVNVGLPRDIEWEGRTVRTAIWKRPVAGPVWARHLNLDGDGQADEVGHGGEQRAVFVYQVDSYEFWSRVLDRLDLECGSFGENFTVEGLEDELVCIGDRYRIGEAVFEVSQPRVTCHKVGIRLKNRALPALLVSQRRPGFYFRVVEEGQVCAGDTIEKILDGPGGMSVADVDELLYGADHPRERLRQVLKIGALSPGWQASFRALLAANLAGQQDGNVGLVGRPEKPPAWLGFRPLRIAAVVQESADVHSFALVSIDASPLPDGQPGQHIAVRLDFDGAVAPIVRFYSLSGATGTGWYRISVKTEGAGSVSERFHAWARAGATIAAAAPQGSFVLRDSARPIVLLSAGIGATPMLAMLHRLTGDARRVSAGVWWLHAARDGGHHAFKSEVADLVAAAPGVRRYVKYSRPTETDLVGKDFDAEGHLDGPALDALGLPKDAMAYVCGPPRFMAEVKDHLLRLGFEPSSIFSEAFGNATPGPGDAEKAPHPPIGSPGDGPTVTFARSGIMTRWSGRYQSLLELAEACDVPTRWSCRTGVCHTCQTPVLEGGVRYDPEPISPAAAGTILLCCARPSSDIQLDL